MDYYLLVSTLSLIFQITVFILLLEGYILKKQQRFRLHGIFMLLSVVLHLVVILALMVPSFVLGVIPLITTQSFDANTILGPVHAATGTAAVVLGVWIVASWRLRQSNEFCAPKKKWMRITLAVWLTALVAGFLFYLSLFGQLLFG
jgi:uncharacterized membrane protein YozB (DUF420 family)